ncbi:YjbF family lipoprotein [Sinimarinibacterium thermocellulolyticum]|uniref:YjbF family lipoprotein n=1 Tax=Sinimarinibacterium thermocellulolyticum TaxID=3170016 RepID=A0ABV2AD52_9GAMM
MKTDRLRSLVVLLAGMIAACGTVQRVRDALPGGDAASGLAGPIAELARLPYASMYVRVGSRFHALMLLGHVAVDGTQTWYGMDGLALQLKNDHVIYTRGLPTDIFESHAAGMPMDGNLDCGDGVSVTALEWLYYTRLRDQQSDVAEVTESVRCVRETIVTLGYSGPALRIEERVALLPDRRRQVRTRWLVEGTGQLLRLEYGDHPWYPEIGLYLIKPVAPR